MAKYLDLDDAVVNVTGNVAKRELDELRRQRSELVEALRRIEQRHGAVESLGSRIIAEQTLANLDSKPKRPFAEEQDEAPTQDKPWYSVYQPEQSASSKPSDVTTWRGAVDHELICTQTATAETYDHDPLQGVRHLIQWHIDTDRYFREQPAVPEDQSNAIANEIHELLLNTPGDYGLPDFLSIKSAIDKHLAEPQPPAEQPAVPEGWSVEDVANKVCANMPEGCAVLLCMEEGSANVELYDLQGDRRLLPDPADKTLLEQLNDAVCVANGWEAEQCK